jgi:hypothetical protein
MSLICMRMQREKEPHHFFQGKVFGLKCVSRTCPVYIYPHWLITFTFHLSPSVKVLKVRVKKKKKVINYY